MSLRRSFILVFSAALTVLAMLASAFSYYSARKEAWSILDFQLQQIAQVVGDGSGLAPAKALAGANDELIAVRVLPFRAGAPVTNDPNVAFPEMSITGFTVFVSHDVEWRLYTDVRPERTVMVAQRTAERNELAADAAWNSAWPFLVAVPLSWFAAYWLVGAVMERLQSIALNVEARSVEDTASLSIENAPLEVRPLIYAINRAFDRVKETLEQQRAFLADAAHELRTPVTVLALQLDNLKQAKNEAERGAAITALEAGVGRAKQIATMLLRLARSESRNASTSAAQTSNAEEAVQECLARFLITAEVKNIDLGVTSIAPCFIGIEPTELAAILDVLLDNALRYTQQGGQIDLSLSYWDGVATITVTDNGPGIPQTLRERVFDRFFRMDPSQSEGSGLGLAIARNLVEKYGGNLRLDDNPGGPGLRVTVSLPLV